MTRTSSRTQGSSFISVARTQHYKRTLGGFILSNLQPTCFAMRGISLVVVAAAGAVAPLDGQTAGGVPDYEAVYRQLTALAPVPGRTASVENLVLERDAARFSMEQGALYLLSPVAGRTVAVGFAGRGRFILTPPIDVEREQLGRFFGSDTLDVEVTALVFFFTDSTLHELERQARFDIGGEVGGAARQVRETLEYLTESKGRWADTDLMRALLNDEGGLFYAFVATRDADDPLLFAISPFAVEEVQLSRREKRTSDRVMETIVQFHAASDYAADGPPTGERAREVRVTRYTIAVALDRTATAGISFAARATLDLTADEPMGPWIALWLYPRLEVDSMRWADGSAATFWHRRESPTVWVRSNSALAPGQTRTLTVHYRGDLVDRFGDAFFVRSSIAWYPRTPGRDVSTFELTFRHPKVYKVSSVGELVSREERDGLVVTHWRSAVPIRNASFSMGMFEEDRFTEEGLPPVIVWTTRDTRKRMRREVGEELLNAIRFYTGVFGPAPMQELRAAEIPLFHGEAFPGLVNLSFGTFIRTGNEGRHEAFRAHEVAHQWWGIGVDYGSYRDQWLSEGMAQFAGLWYMQTERRDNEKYFKTLRDWRDDLMTERGSLFRKGVAPGPIWLGYRTSTSSNPGDFGLIVYAKGAWTLHMLRILLLDLQTVNEDRLKGLLREAYTSHRGRRMTTEDFRLLAEKHAGIDLGWFFDQWVYGTAIPTYRVSWTADETPEGKYRARLRVLQENVPDDFLAFVPVSVDFGNDRWARVRVRVQGPLSEVELPILPLEPKDIVFNDLEGVLARVETVKRESW